MMFKIILIISKPKVFYCNKISLESVASQLYSVAIMSHSRTRLNNADSNLTDNDKCQSLRNLINCFRKYVLTCNIETKNYISEDRNEIKQFTIDITKSIELCFVEIEDE